MGIFDLVTPMLYWVITILWLVIVGIYLVKIRQLKAVDGAISGTLIILLVIRFVRLDPLFSSLIKIHLTILVILFSISIKN